MWVNFANSRIIPVSDTGIEADFRHSFAGPKLMPHLLTHTFAPFTMIDSNHLKARQTAVNSSPAR